MGIQNFLKAIGTGPKGNRDLSFDEAKEVMLMMLQAKMYPEQIAAFLLGWRLKPESVEEFQGALLACDELTQHTQMKHSLELGYPFDGKAKHPYLLGEIATLCETFELPLITYKDELVPAKDGVTIKQYSQARELSSNLHIFDRANYLPQLHQLTQIRQRLMLRTGLNTIEKLPHVAKSLFAITAVHHKPYVKKYIEVFADRYERFALIQGNEGTPELFKNGTLWVVQEGKIEEIEVKLETYGIRPIKSVERLSVVQMAQMLQNRDENLRKLIALNAAIWLFVANRFPSIEAAFEKTVARI